MTTIGDKFELTLWLKENNLWNENLEIPEVETGGPLPKKLREWDIINSGYEDLIFMGFVGGSNRRPFSIEVKKSQHAYHISLVRADPGRFYGAPVHRARRHRMTIKVGKRALQSERSFIKYVQVVFKQYKLEHYKPRIILIELEK